MADDTFLPHSDESLKEMALQDLEIRLQVQATRIPCPQCGSYPQSHADHVKRTTGRVTAWILFVLGFIALVTLVAKTFPTAPSTVMVPLAMVAWLGARMAAGAAAARSDPNLDLERNRNLAHERMARGLLRTLPPPPALPPPP